MRIAMVTETYPPEVNGVARTIGLMADGLHRRGTGIPGRSTTEKFPASEE
jgi:hypothetical protein